MPFNYYQRPGSLVCETAANKPEKRILFFGRVPTLQRLRFLHEEVFGLFKMKGRGVRTASMSRRLAAAKQLSNHVEQV